MSAPGISVGCIAYPNKKNWRVDATIVSRSWPRVAVANRDRPCAPRNREATTQVAMDGAGFSAPLGEIPQSAFKQKLTRAAKASRIASTAPVSLLAQILPYVIRGIRCFERQLFPSLSHWPLDQT
jgi:hypothetical protein